MKVFVSMFVLVAAAAAQSSPDPSKCPMHDEHMKKQAAAASDHHAQVDSRGDHAMGFSHEKTAHHFRLYKDGGAIEVVVKDSADAANLAEIRGHLTQIAQMFNDGNFEVPMFIHATTVPGTVVMKDRRGKIAYRFEQTELGARVRILTKDRKSLDAVHEFLRFQISDHRTGDIAAVSGF